jgi:hypothetical protein
MGANCTGNPVDFIMNEYGADVAKLVSSLKAKELIDQKLPAIKDQLSQKTQEFQSTSMKQIETQQS